LPANIEFQEFFMKVEEQSEQGTTAAPVESKHSARGWLFGLVAIIVIAVVVVFTILPRIQAHDTLVKETQEMAIPSVNVVRPQHTAPAQEVVLPANVQAYSDAPIYARTNGYLQHWYVDIGAHVKAGQLLAEIDTPEVNQQLRQSLADLATAQANVHLAQITSDRYADLLKSDSVSKQDADNAATDYAAKNAGVQSAQANVKRLEDLQSFEKIYAPFAGVITARNTDIGALIDPGSSGGTRTELFHIAQPGKLRVYVNVPEAYSQAAKVGLTADLTLTEFPGRRFQGKLVRTAASIDLNSRTLLVEIAVDNPTGELLTGAYAEVHLKIPTANSAFILPVDTLLFRSEGLRVVVVNNNQAELRPITIGHDFGSTVEVVSGLTGDENVVANPPDSIEPGENVRMVQPTGGTGK
jgi:RND family efflux transporter MFP subunit